MKMITIKKKIMIKKLAFSIGIKYFTNFYHLTQLSNENFFTLLDHFSIPF